MNDIRWHRSTLTASDGIELAVFTAGVRAGPTVLLVHGYPDDHRVWDGAARSLATQFRLLAFDVRGAGASQTPARRSGYLLEQLVRDIDAVADSGGARAHLLAHDWGSVQAWEAVTRPGAQARYASITSISGPGLAYSSAWYRTTWRTDRRAVLRQAGASWYVLVFLLPWVPELLWRAGVVQRLLGKPRRARSVADGVHGLALYRANLGSTRTARPAACPVPALVIAPRADPFITAAYALRSPVPWVRELRTRIVEGGHWTMLGHPERIAEPVIRFVHDVDAGGNWETGPRA